jgi:putative hydrolase of the HAD superfamily
MTVQAVFFDMGGTIETFSYTREFRLAAVPGLRERLARAGIELGLSDEQLLDLVVSGMLRYHQWRLQTLQELTAAHIWRDFILAAYPDCWEAVCPAAEELMMYYERHFYRRQMRPEMPAVLEAIRKLGLKIGVISNVCSRGQVPVNLAQYGIQHYFNPIVLSCEYGRRKPDPAIFHYAARLANVPTSHCVYVGDLITRDIVGARRAGYRLAVQIRHAFNRDEPEVGATPDAVIEDMNDLLTLLEVAQAPATVPPGPVRAILFDAGDILYHRPHRGRQFNAFLRELGLNPDVSHLSEKVKLADQAYSDQISQDSYREALVRLHGVTQPEDIQRGIEILSKEDENVHFFTGVRKTLLELKARGYLLGVVTDTASSVSVKLRWFEKGGFGSVWDSIISSKELGVRKPHPQLYQAALQQLGLSADQVIFVGHKATELDGARAVGLKTAAFNYEKSAMADCYIEKFADLLNIPLIGSPALASTR